MKRQVGGRADWRIKHGATAGRRSPEYVSWMSMRQRCGNPNHVAYASYGGRGIRVCERWLNSFANFYADMGPKPTPQHSLDRYPNKDGNYEPGNVRWATPKEQQRNTKMTTYLTVAGVTRSRAEWAELSGIPAHAIKGRLEAGWDPRDAVSVPTQAHRAVRR